MLRELRLRRALDRANVIESVILDHPGLTWRAISTAIMPDRQTCLIRAEGAPRAVAELKRRYVKRPPREVERAELLSDERQAIEWLDVERSGIAETDISSLIYEEFGAEVAIGLHDDIDGRHWRLLTPREDAIPRFLGRLKEHESAMDRVSQRAIPRYELVAYAEARQGSSSTLSAFEALVLRTAVRAGYYADPRTASVKDVATRLGMPASTVHRWLRRAEAKAVSASVDATSPSRDS